MKVASTLSTASQIEPLPAFPSPGAASGLKKAVFTHFLELCSHFSFNHRDISINVFLKPNYTAGTEMVNTTYNQVYQRNNKILFHKTGSYSGRHFWLFLAFKVKSS